MTNEQILRKAVKKAEKNGYEWIYSGMDVDVPIAYWTIFSHDFAKAFWGEEMINAENRFYMGSRWTYHLQKMVLEKEPLEYLEKFL